MTNKIDKIDEKITENLKASEKSLLRVIPLASHMYPTYARISNNHDKAVDLYNRHVSEDEWILHHQFFEGLGLTTLNFLPALFYIATSIGMKPFYEHAHPEVLAIPFVTNLVSGAYELYRKR